MCFFTLHMNSVGQLEHRNELTKMCPTEAGQQSLLCVSLFQMVDQVCPAQLESSSTGTLADGFAIPRKFDRTGRVGPRSARCVDPPCLAAPGCRLALAAERCRPWPELEPRRPQSRKPQRSATAPLIPQQIRNREQAEETCEEGHDVS